MIVIERKRYIFTTKEVWFSDYIGDISGCHQVTFRRCKAKVNVEGFTRKESPTIVINLNQDIDAIWNDMDKSSCRYAVKRAKRDNIEIETNQHYEEFYEMYQSFRKKRGLIGRPDKLEVIKEHGTLFVAMHNKEILAANAYLEDGSIILFWIGCSKRLEAGREKATLIGNAARLIHWEAMNYAKAKGIEEFDMGGLFAVEGKDYPGYSIDKVKRSFGGEIAVHYQYDKAYSHLYRFAGRLYHFVCRWL